MGVELEFEFPNGGGGAATIVEGVQSGRIYTFDLSARLTKLLPLPRSFRFCMSAVDTSLNESKPSCARFRFVGKKPKRR